MKISILTVDFQQAIKKLNTITQNKDQNYRGILLTTDNNEIILKKSNGDNQLKITLDAHIIEDGSLFIPQNTVKLIEKLKNVTFLQIDDNFIQADKKKIKYSQMPISEYWDIKDICNISAFEVSQKELTRMLCVKYAIAKDSTRPILQGINIHNNIFCALDGYIVSLRESKEFNTDLNVTITQDNIKILDKLINKKSDSKVIVYNNLEVNDIITQTTYIKYVIDNVELISKVLIGDFINYKSIIPENSYTTVKIHTLQ